MLLCTIIAGQKRNRADVVLTGIRSEARYPCWTTEVSDFTCLQFVFLHFLFAEKCLTFSGSGISVTVWRSVRLLWHVIPVSYHHHSVTHCGEQSLTFSGSDTESAAVGEAVSVPDNNVTFYWFVSRFYSERNIHFWANCVLFWKPCQRGSK